MPRPSREARKALYRELKGHPCTDCGKTYASPAMEWDHVDDDKNEAIATLVNRERPLEVVLAEIAKCELVCCICHAVRTWNRRHPDDPITSDPI